MTRGVHEGLPRMKLLVILVLVAIITAIGIYLTKPRVSNYGDVQIANEIIKSGDVIISLRCTISNRVEDCLVRCRVQSFDIECMETGNE